MLEVKIKRRVPGFFLDIDFSIGSEIMSILGPSGSGKTMTLHCIAGLTNPDEGYIKLNGKFLYDSNNKINLSPQMRKVGFVFQNYALFPHLTVRDNIAFGIRHLTKPEIETKVSGLLETMNITNLGERYPKQLSGGQQQRVALARAIAPEPDLLLLDEPFSALDTHIKEKLELELLSLQSYFKGNILMVTHNLSEGYKLCSKMAIYDSGHLIQCDDRQNVIDFPANFSVARLIGMKNLFNGVVRKIQDNNAWVYSDQLQAVLRIECKQPLSLDVDREIIVGIRPEYVHLSDNPVENAVGCIVERMVEGISAVNCFFKIKAGDSQFVLEGLLPVSYAERLQIGQECYVHMHPEHLAVMPKTGDDDISIS